MFLSLWRVDEAGYCARDGLVGCRVVFGECSTKTTARGQRNIVRTKEHNEREQRTIVSENERIQIGTKAEIEKELVETSLPVN